MCNNEYFHNTQDYSSKSNTVSIHITIIIIIIVILTQE